MKFNKSKYSIIFLILGFYSLEVFSQPSIFQPSNINSTELPTVPPTRNPNGKYVVGFFPNYLRTSENYRYKPWNLWLKSMSFHSQANSERSTSIIGFTVSDWSKKMSLYKFEPCFGMNLLFSQVRMGIAANQQVQSTSIGFAACGGAIGLAIDKLNEEQKINNWEFEWVFDLKSINMFMTESIAVKIYCALLLRKLKKNNFTPLWVHSNFSLTYLYLDLIQGFYELYGMWPVGGSGCRHHFFRRLQRGSGHCAALHTR